MCRRLPQATSIALLAVLLIVLAPAAEGTADPAGTVHFVRPANTEFNSFTSNPSPEAQAWLRSHMWRMLVWSPYFDSKTAWYPQGWLYQDAYAVYKSSQLALGHPDWILRDSSGNALYIPYGCSGGSCPQYAGDISNAAFRHNWIEEARAHLAHGYRGLFVDDVNMEERVGNGSGASVLPIGLGGATITATAWRSYMAEFMSEIRAAFPGIEIVHNAIWYANSHAGPSDPSIRREIEAANYINLERGVNDSGLTGGTGPWSLQAFLSYVDSVHALGRGVDMDGSSPEVPGMEYNLASYFLISTGNDAVGSHGQTPSNWWPGFDVNLGEASGIRHAWGNVLRRDFSGGIVLVNPPGAATQNISLPGPMRNVGGSTVTSVTLPAASGAVLRSVQGTPLTASLSQAGGGLLATQTTLEARVVGAHPSRAAPALGLGRHLTSRKTHRRRHHHHSRRRHHGGHRAHAARRAGAHQRRLHAVLARISGVVRQASRGTVTIYVEIRRRHRWAGIARLNLSVDAAGHFQRLMRLRTAHSYRAHAVYLGADGYRPSSSGYRVLVLRRG